jgi:predicted acetyltransferase
MYPAMTIREQSAIAMQMAMQDSDGGQAAIYTVESKPCGYVLYHDEGDEVLVDEWALDDLSDFEDMMAALTAASPRARRVCGRGPADLTQHSALAAAYSTIEPYNMLRIIDFSSFFRGARVRDAVPAVIGVIDPDCPWNNGTYMTGAADGRMTVERSDAAADFTMDITAPAEFLLGYWHPETLLQQGIVRGDAQLFLRWAASVQEEKGFTWELF